LGFLMGHVSPATTQAHQSLLGTNGLVTAADEFFPFAAVAAVLTPHAKVAVRALLLPGRIRAGLCCRTCPPALLFLFHAPQPPSSVHPRPDSSTVRRVRFGGKPLSSASSMAYPCIPHKTDSKLKRTGCYKEHG
jgi:hypothetical protein